MSSGQRMTVVPSRMALQQVKGKLVGAKKALQTSVIILDEAIKLTNRRVNALENVVKPKLENTIAYVISEIDKMEREELFRLKLIQNKK